jgi:hypothetical protein
MDTPKDVSEGNGERLGRARRDSQLEQVFARYPQGNCYGSHSANEHGTPCVRRSYPQRVDVSVDGIEQNEQRAW